MTHSSFTRVLRYGYEIIGSPTALTRYLGNPESKVSDYRLAIYHALGRREPMEEERAVWDDKTS